MSPDDRIRLQHMRDAAEAARRFCGGRTRPDLDSDDMLRFALTRAVQIIGEAASKVSHEARAETSRVPWAAVVGMRNRLVHAYFDVDADILWTTVTESLPALLSELQSTLGKD